MIIGVTGGKGGVGKSTISIGLSKVLSKKGRVLLVDADVGCPNLHIILKEDRLKIRDVKRFVPVFNEDKCSKCGKCSEFCESNAIVSVKDKIPFVVEEQCNGCRGCEVICPNNAVEEGERVIGSVYSMNREGFDYLGGETRVGFEEEGVLVNEVMQEVKRVEEEYDFIIVDTSAGAHCPVINALRHCDYSIIVTEPTRFAVHDMKLILELTKILRLEKGVVVNKCGTGGEELMQNAVREFEFDIVSKIPYSEELFNSYIGSTEFNTGLFTELEDVVNR